MVTTTTHFLQGTEAVQWRKRLCVILHHPNKFQEALCSAIFEAPQKTKGGMYVHCINLKENGTSVPMVFFFAPRQVSS